jgi:hypothetical protein
MPAAYAADIDVAPPPQAAEPTPPEPVAATSYTVSIPVLYPHPWWCGYLGVPASLRCVAWRLRVARHPSAPLGRPLSTETLESQTSRAVGGGKLSGCKWATAAVHQANVKLHINSIRCPHATSIDRAACPGHHAGCSRRGRCRARSNSSVALRSIMASASRRRSCTSRPAHRVARLPLCCHRGLLIRCVCAAG